MKPGQSSIAEQAFLAHAALLKAEAREPSLGSNPCWTVLRQDAYERAFLEIEKLGA